MDNPVVRSSGAKFESPLGHEHANFYMSYKWPFVIQSAACESRFKPGWMTDRGSGSQFWYENWAGLLRRLYARDCVFWKRVTCAARSEASSAWVSSNRAYRTWDRTRNI